MLMLVALLAQIGAAPAGGPALGVRRSDGIRQVPEVVTPTGPFVRADLLSGALDGRVRRLANDAGYAIELAGTEFDVSTGLPFARVADAVLPLASAPVVQGGRLLVPLQLAAEYLPAYGSGVNYDPSANELRLFPPQQARRPLMGASSAQTAQRATDSGETSAAPARGGRRRLVVVDAGHGGPDHGMTGPIGATTKILEKDITLAVARRLAAALRSRGLDVVMTRTSDTLIALGDRGRIANQAHADLFLSVHVNAANPSWREPAKARGFETYFLAEAKTEEESRVEAMENESVRFETGANAPKGDPLSFIITDMAQNEHLRESNDLAGAIQRGLGRVEPGPSRGVKQANFAVLRTSFMPAVLVEIGFGTNVADATFIDDPAEQGHIADAIADATLSYLGRYARRVGSDR